MWFSLLNGHIFVTADWYFIILAATTLTSWQKETRCKHQRIHTELSGHLLKKCMLWTNNIILIVHENLKHIYKRLWSWNNDECYKLLNIKRNQDMYNVKGSSSWLPLLMRFSDQDYNKCDVQSKFAMLVCHRDLLAPQGGLVVPVI